MDVRIVTREAPGEADRQAVLDQIIAYNEAAVGPAHYQPVAIMLEDENGAVLGGLWGKTAYDWMFVELLAIAPELRGRDHGTALMREAERVARARGCAGIWLDSYSFQARGFYEKLGYEVFGSIPGHPRGGERFFFRKYLEGGAAQG